MSMDLKDTGASSAGHSYDVVIVGAGISGIGAAYHLTRECKDQSFVVLEMQDTFGGTWNTHRYPGVRSDSDLYTFGYEFKPWTGAPIATGQEILDYLGEVISENGLERHIKYGHKINGAHWSSQENRWTLEVERSDGEFFALSTRFLWMCQGYYRHSEGYLPRWKGDESFEGRIVHPQNWPQNLDLTNKRVAVIGSGATAASLVPAIADTCEHVTLVQRSPGYYRTGRNLNELADSLRQLEIDEAWIHEIVRRRVLFDQHALAKRTFKDPDGVQAELLAGVAAFVRDPADMASHFTPSYRPWSQRILFVPNGDLFETIASGKASIKTDQIEHFTRTGVQLCSGELVKADIVVAATGFNLNVMGDAEFTIDGEPLDFARTVTYRGMMFTSVPNFVWVFGYFRAAWTMRVDLISEFVCRLLNHMNKTGVARVIPTLREEDRDMPLSAWVSPDNFNPGYLNRSIHLLPKCGDRPPWENKQDYWLEKDEFPNIDLCEPALVYEGKTR